MIDKRKGRVLADAPPSRPEGTEDQAVAAAPAAFTRAARRDILRATVFLCTTPW